MINIRISHKFESVIFKKLKILRYYALCDNVIYVNRYLRKMYEIKILIAIFSNLKTHRENVSRLFPFSFKE